MEAPMVYASLSIVDCAFSLHNAPIHSFKIRSTAEFCTYPFDRWILHLSRNPIRDFTLKLHRNMPRRPYHVHSSLFSCKDLSHLKLSNCSLTLPPKFQGFRHLKSLGLKRVGAMMQSDLEKLIATSPLLERLSLEHFEGTIKRLKIKAPNLHFLKLRGDLQHDIDHIRNTLNRVHYVSLEPKLAYGEWHTLLKTTPSISELEISFRVLKCQDYKKANITSWRFPCMQRLKITGFMFDKFHVDFIKLLFLSCPNLQELQVLASPHNPNISYNDFIREGLRYNFRFSYNATMQRLKAMGLYGHKCELELVKFLLLRCPLLQEVHVLFDEDGDRRRRSICKSEDDNDDEDEGDLELKQVRVMSIRGFSNAEDEVGFVKFMLRSAPMIKELILKPQCANNVSCEVSKLLWLKFLDSSSSESSDENRSSRRRRKRKARD